MDASWPDLANPARLINAEWDFASIWTTVALAIEQFELHAPARQDGLLLEWCDARGCLTRLAADDIRAMLASIKSELLNTQTPVERRRAAGAARV